VKAVCVIPMRYASTRLPGKALLKILDKPLIVHTIERAQKARSLSSLLVATDDERIVEVVRKHCPDVQVEMTRQDHASGTDRIAEVIAKVDCDVVVNVQGDEPMIDPALIDQLVEVFDRDAGLKMATARVKISQEAAQDPNCVKVVTDASGNALYFSRAPIPYERGPEQAPEAHYYKHLGIYSYRRDFLLEYAKWPQSGLEQIEQLEQLRALDQGIQIRVIETQHDSIGVDTQEDYERLKQQMAVEN